MCNTSHFSRTCSLLIFSMLQIKTEKLVDHGPSSQIREFFLYGDKRIYLFSDMASFSEASAICEAEGMHLINLDEPTKAQFVAKFVTRAWLMFEDVWIGAKQNNSAHEWSWVWTKQAIPKRSQIFNGSFMFPPWLNEHAPANSGKQCLMLSKNTHNGVHFVDSDCKQPRPFMCEQNNKSADRNPRIGNIVDLSDFKLLIYHGSLSWQAAVSFCKQQGYALATIKDATAITKLTTTMLKSRPEFENAWIGAYFKNGKWLWVESGEEIKSMPEMFSSIQGKEQECVVLDRHFYSQPKFIALSCSRRRDFICIDRSKNEEELDAIFVIERNSKRYIFFPVLATWDEAKQICEEESASTAMLTLSDVDETKFIMKAMANAERPIDHLWLGGKIEGGEWVWIGKESDIETLKILTTPDEADFPPWCDSEIDLNLPCLVLDRQNRLTPLIYGLECNSTQPVACVEVADKDNVEHVTRREYDEEEEPSDSAIWNQASEACSTEIYNSSQPKFNVFDSIETADDFFTLLKLEHNGNQNGRTYMGNNRHVWAFNKKNINIMRGWKANDDCLAGGRNVTSEWAWLPVKCLDQNYAQAICKPQCYTTEASGLNDSSKWICNAVPSSFLDHRITGIACNHRCPLTHVSQGPDQYFCTKTSEATVKTPNYSVNTSSCNNVKNGLDVFKDVPQGTSVLAFIVDSTSDNDATKFFLSHLVDYYRMKLENLIVYLVFIPTGTAAITVKKFKPSDNCDEIKQHIIKQFQHEIGVRDYGEGLSKIKEALGDFPLDRVHIVFVTHGHNQKGKFKQKANELNVQAKLFALGTNRQTVISQLVDMASKVEGKSLAIQFSKPLQLIESVKHLIASCRTCKCKDAFSNLIQDTLSRG